MIVGIDHIVLLCPSIEIGTSVYETLLGRPADWTTHDPAGSASAFFQLNHMAIELLAPQGDGPMAKRLHELLAQDGPGLQTVVFASDALEEDHQVSKRRGLHPEPIIDGESIDLTTGNKRQWRRFRFDSAQSGGLRTFVLQRSGKDPLLSRPSSAGALIDLDHLVISTEQPERALAWYGARLGFKLTLDKTNAAQNSRLLTFSAGTAKIEVTLRASNAPVPKPDRLWGITWQTADIEAAHSRMTGSGLATSEVRQGMRRGTRVFTVREGTLSVPTLIVENIQEESGGRNT